MAFPASQVPTYCGFSRLITTSVSRPTKIGSTRHEHEVYTLLTRQDCARILSPPHLTGFRRGFVSLLHCPSCSDSFPNQIPPRARQSPHAVLPALDGHPAQAVHQTSTAESLARIWQRA